MNSIPKLCLLVIQVLIVFSLQQVLANTRAGEVWESRALNCAITLPAGSDWSRINPPVEMLKVVAQNKKGDTILLFVGDAPQDGRTLESFLPGFKQSYFPEGASTMTSEETLQINGRSARRLKGMVKIQGIEMQRVTIVIIDNNRVYQIAAMSREIDPLADPEIREAIDSFHFLNLSSAVHKIKPARNLSSFIGHLTFYAMVGIAVVYMIVKCRKPKNKNSVKGLPPRLP